MPEDGIRKPTTFWKYDLYEQSNNEGQLEARMVPMGSDTASSFLVTGDWLEFRPGRRCLQPVMEGCVVLVCADEKVCRAVVRLDAVDVMHDLGLRVAAPELLELATNDTFGNEDVFVLLGVRPGSNHDIAVAAHTAISDGPV